VEGFSLPGKRSDRVVLEANTAYWDPQRLPRIRRIVFDHTLSQKEAVDLVKAGEGRVDLVTSLSPLETLRAAESGSAVVVKNRGGLETVFGLFNMRKRGSPWNDLRLRQAANLAINRVDLIRYGARGNGVVIPALLPAQSFGHDPGLAPYPFEPSRARTLVREAGQPTGLAVTLLAPDSLEAQATVVGKMLEQAGFRVDRQVLDAAAFAQKTERGRLDHPAENQTWDIALMRDFDWASSPISLYEYYALDGPLAWLADTPELQRLYDLVLRTVDREKQQDLIRQMERRTHDQAYFLFLYNPIPLYVANKAVSFTPYVDGWLRFAETSVTDQHWSVRNTAKP
jgi:ABC-type transport system substrate-binding protein